MPSTTPVNATGPCDSGGCSGFDRLAVAAGVDDFYIGPAVLFRRGRLPGAKNLGEAGESSGIAALRAELARLPRDIEVVVYCGCCAVRVCPNVRPADAALATIGRPGAWLLDLPTNLRTDWTDAGYPTETG